VVTPKPRGRVRKILGYSAAFVAAFVFFIYVTFPYGVVEEMITKQARTAGVAVRIGSLGPGFFGVTAKQVKIAPPSAGAEASSGVIIDSIAVRPALFPPGVAVRAQLFGGTATGSMGALRKRPPVQMQVFGVDLSRAGLKEMFGAELKGVLKAKADMSLDIADVTKTTGQLDLDLKDVVISGSLPKINAGEIEGLLKLEGGKMLVDHLSVNGTDVEADAEGSITLNKQLFLSMPQLKAKFKLKPAFTEGNGIGGSIKVILFQQYNANPDSQGFYNVTIDGGFLSNPKYRFGR
jgi:type II secretion system protein N